MAAAPSSPGNQGVFTVTIRTMTGKEVPLEGVTRQTTILRLKELFAEKEGVPTYHQRYVWKAVVLKKGQTLAECGIDGPTLIYLVPFHCFGGSTETE